MSQRVEPSDKVKRKLRKEVGFGCPVESCGSPYLEYHHFDPPYRKLAHNNPEGMIALCSFHHPQGDNSAFTTEQLHEMKKRAADFSTVKGRFNWLRRNLIVIAGSIITLETPSIFLVNSRKAVWLNRDKDGYHRLNIDTPGIQMRDNDWLVSTNNLDIISPPGGRTLRVLTKSGERIYLEFKEINDEGELAKLTPMSASVANRTKFPFTVLLFEYSTPEGVGPRISIDKDKMVLGHDEISHGVIARASGAVRYTGPTPAGW